MQRFSIRRRSFFGGNYDIPKIMVQEFICFLFWCLQANWQSRHKLDRESVSRTQMVTMDRYTPYIYHQDNSRSCRDYLLSWSLYVRDSLHWMSSVTRFHAIFYCLWLAHKLLDLPGDLLARQLVWEYLLACQLEVPIVPLVFWVSLDCRTHHFLRVARHFFLKTVRYLYRKYIGN